MTTFDKSGLLDKAVRTGTLEPDDVLALRRAHYADGVIGEPEAALVDFMRSDDAPLPAGLVTLVGRLPKAA